MKKAQKKVSNQVAYGLGIGVCWVLLAGMDVASPIDVSFGFGSTLSTSSPAVSGANNWGLIYDVGSTTGAGVGNIGWSNSVNRISLNGTTFGSAASTGFYHVSVYSSPPGMVVFKSNTASHTFGINSLPAVGRNSANFHNQYSAGDLGQDALGVVGFRSSEGNSGYIEFDWNESTSTLTVLSAKIQRFAGQPITFTPSAVATR